MEENKISCSCCDCVNHKGECSCCLNFIKIEKDSIRNSKDIHSTMCASYVPLKKTE